MPGRKWTPEEKERQRIIMRERMTERNARKKEEQAAVAAILGADEAAPSEANVTDELKALASKLYRVAEDKAERGKTLDELETFLARLPSKDFPELAQSEIVQNFVEMMMARSSETRPDDPPGTVYNRGAINQYKKAWTEEDLRRSDIAVMEFEVNEPETVVWCGIRRDYQPGTVYYDYRCFVDLIREKARNLRLAEEHVAYMFKRRNSLTDITIANMSTARIRGTADQGSYVPAGGFFEPGYSIGSDTE